MKVLVTGGAGFIGSHVIDLLLSRGYEVVAVDNLITGHAENIPSIVKLIQMDITSPEISDIFEQEKPDKVLHLAAQIDVAQSIIDPAKDAEINIIGTLRLLSCCVKFNVRKMVFSSSCAVYGDPSVKSSITEAFPVRPLSFYGTSKYCAEHYMKLYEQLYGLSCTVLRYANVYGPRQAPKGEGGVIPIFIKNLREGKQPVIYGDGEQTRDFVYVKDVAAANVLALTHKGNDVFNIGCNQKTSVNQLYRLLANFMHTQVSPIYRPSRTGDIRDSALDYTRAKQGLGWKPVYDLRSGLQEMFEHL